MKEKTVWMHNNASLKRSIYSFEECLLSAYYMSGTDKKYWGYIDE